MVPSLSSGQCTLYTVQCPLPSTDLNFLSTFLVKEIRAFFHHFFPSSICLQIFSTSISWNTKVLERGVNSNHLLACSLINSFVITVSWSSSQADQRYPIPSIHPTFRFDCSKLLWTLQYWSNATRPDQIPWGWCIEIYLTYLPLPRRRKGQHHRKHMLDDPPNMINLINYVMLFFS